MLSFSTPKKLYPLLERPIAGDDPKSLLIHEFDLATRAYTGVHYRYPLDARGTNIGDFILYSPREGLVIERDGTQGDLGGFKRIHEVELREAGTNVAKEARVDLMRIPDRTGSASPASPATSAWAASSPSPSSPSRVWEPGQPWRVRAVLVLQVGAVVRAGDRGIGEAREVAEQEDRADSWELPVHAEQGAEIEGLNVGAVLKPVAGNCAAKRGNEDFRAEGAVLELGARVDLGLDVVAYLFGIGPAQPGIGMRSARATAIVLDVGGDEIEQLLYRRYDLGVDQPLLSGERDRHR